MNDKVNAVIEPYIAGQCTIQLYITIHPDMTATAVVRSHDETPVVGSVPLSDFAGETLAALIAQYNASLPARGIAAAEKLAAEAKKAAEEAATRAARIATAKSKTKKPAVLPTRAEAINSVLPVEVPLTTSDEADEILSDPPENVEVQASLL